MVKFDLVKTSKTGQLKVYDYTGKVNQKSAKKYLNRFRREIKKENPNARMSISFKVQKEDAEQNTGYFWNSLPMRSVGNEVILPSQYNSRISQISVQVLNS